jgi:hypothetical protein
MPIQLPEHLVFFVCWLALAVLAACVLLFVWQSTLTRLEASRSRKETTSKSNRGDSSKSSVGNGRLHDDE